MNTGSAGEDAYRRRPDYIPSDPALVAALALAATAVAVGSREEQIEAARRQVRVRSPGARRGRGPDAARRVGVNRPAQEPADLYGGEYARIAVFVGAVILVLVVLMMVLISKGCGA